MQQKFSMSLNILFIIVFVICYLHHVKGDLPVHCLVEDVTGEWVIRINKDTFDAFADNLKTTCGHGLPNKVDTSQGPKSYHFDQFSDINIRLDKNYKVYENSQEVGRWTPVYDQSFYIYYKNSILTAPYMYYNSGPKVVSDCSKTLMGWYTPDKTQRTKNWSCFFAFKGVPSNNFLGSASMNFLQLSSTLVTSKTATNLHSHLKYEHLTKVVKEINNANLLWKAQVHDEFKGMTFSELKRHLGMEKNKNAINENNKSLDYHMVKKGKPNLLQTSVEEGINSKEKMNMELAEFLENLNKEEENIKKINLNNRAKRIGSGQVALSADPFNLGENPANTQIFNAIPAVNSPSPSASTSTGASASTPSPMRDADSSFVTDPHEMTKYLNTPIEDMDASKLPKNWDWRNVGGVNYVPSVKRQGDCGSCYVFSTVTTLEARLRIQTNNMDRTEFSKQFPLSCNFYSEGCDGGYPFLVGKFFNEFEIVPEECFKYTQTNDKCSNVCDYKKLYSKKYRVSSYGYIGGYYGATNEELMMKELRARGPIPGNIRVPYTFNYYKEGIYSESELNKNSDKLNKTTMTDRHLSWEKVEHSITLVGYGEENGVKYWIGMNTWGQNWGDKGFFKILRGENECAIESMGDYLTIEVTQR